MTRELAAAVTVKRLTNKHAATNFALVIAGVIAALPVGGQIETGWEWETAGKGGLILWPLLGAMSELLGGLAFPVIAFWLWRRGMSVWFGVIPMIFLFILPGVAMTINVFSKDGYLLSAMKTGQWMLAGFGIAAIAFEIWMITEALIAWTKSSRGSRGPTGSTRGEGIFRRRLAVLLTISGTPLRSKFGKNLGDSLLELFARFEFDDCTGRDGDSGIGLIRVPSDFRPGFSHLKGTEIAKDNIIIGGEAGSHLFDKALNNAKHLLLG